MKLSIIYQDRTRIIFKEIAPQVFTLEEAESLLISNEVNVFRNGVEIK